MIKYILFRVGLFLYGFHLHKIIKKNENNYELFMGPYITIKTLKNDYIVLNELGFEEIDIKIN